MKKQINTYLFPILLIALEIFLFIKNIKPGTYLIGWDNLMPEFNPILNIKRSLFSVWQEYRGLGLYDGMAHAANLVHSLTIGIVTLVLPQNVIRYTVVTTLHLFGGLGMYFLVNTLIKKRPIAFIGALFYMFNIGVIQQFYAPLEVFAYHFTALPWLIWSGLKYIYKPNKSTLIIFFLIALLSTPQGFVPTIFIAGLSVIATLLFIDLATHRNIRRFIVLFVVYLAVNSFWLVPYLYGAPTTAKIITNARINKYSSETLFLRNKQYGSLVRVLSLDGFMLHLSEFDSKAGQNVNLMAIWEQYTHSNIYIGVYILLLYFGIVGIVTNIKNVKRLPYLIPLLAAFFFLANNTPIVKELNQLLRVISPILGEAFRIPFTKWITVFAFSLSLFITFGIDYFITGVLNHKGKMGVYVFLMFITLFLGFPAFQGNFYSNLVRRQLPKDYLNVIDYFKTVDKNKRISLLPAHTFWNWQYRSWGHVGSGFLWYGIQQPILERAFDPWSNLNEQFYNELSYAINNENDELFTSVLKKYNIDYFIVDQYLVATLTSKPINYTSLISFLNRQTSIQFDKEFGNILVYKTTVPSHSQFLFTLFNSRCTTNSNEGKFYEDNLYLDKQDYIQCQNSPKNVTYPFMNLFTEVMENSISILNNDKYIIFESPKLNTGSNNQYETTLILPPITKSILIPTQIDFADNLLTIKILSPKIFTNFNEVIYETPTVQIQTQTNNPEEFNLIEQDKSFNSGDVILLDKNNPNTISLISNGKGEYITVELYKYSFPPIQIPIIIQPNSTIQAWVPKIYTDYEIQTKLKKDIVVDELNPITFENAQMPHQEGYVGFIASRWKEGLPLNFFVENGYKKKPQMEMRGDKEKNTQSIIVPPSNDPYFGYTVHVDETQIGDKTSVSTLRNIELYPFPYEFISHIQLESTKEFSIKDTNPMVHSNGYFEYDLTISNGVNTTLVQSQSFNPGWKAYKIKNANEKISLIETIFPFFFGNEITNHVLVNNWENGWVLEDQSPSHIVVLFLPQYFEFIGFIVLFFMFVFILLIKQSKHIVHHPVN